MPPPKKTWKAVERRVAKRFGTLRNRGSGSSGREDESCSDSKHETLYIETKYRQRTWVRTELDKAKEHAKKEEKTPVLIVADKGKRGFIVCVHVSDLKLVALELDQIYNTVDGDDNDG